MTTIILFKSYEQELFYSTKKMFLHGFLIKQYNPTGFMLLQKPVKGCLHRWYTGYQELKLRIG